MEALDAVPGSSQAVSIALCGKPQSCNSGSKEAGLVHGLDPLKGTSNSLEGSWYQTGWEAHHSHLPAGYLSRRPYFERCVCEVSCWGWWGRASVQVEHLRRWCQDFWIHFKKQLNNLLKGKKVDRASILPFELLRDFWWLSILAARASSDYRRNCEE